MKKYTNSFSAKIFFRNEIFFLLLYNHHQCRIMPLSHKTKSDNITELIYSRPSVDGEKNSASAIDDSAPPSAEGGTDVNLRSIFTFIIHCR